MLSFHLPIPIMEIRNSVYLKNILYKRKNIYKCFCYYYNFDFNNAII